MDSPTYQRALQSGNTVLLEDLAAHAGYTKRFNPFDAKMMRARPLRFVSSLERETQTNTNEEKFHQVYFWIRDSRWRSLHPFLGLLSQRKAIDYAINDSPRTDWKVRYEDFFTRIKRTDQGTYFVDCWRPKSGRESKRVLMAGRITKEYDFQDQRLDEETTTILNLARNRENYPPYSTRELLQGPTIDWVLTKVGGGASFFTAILAISYAFKHKENGFYYASAATAGFEFLMHWLLYGSVGKGYFRKEGIKVGEEAVELLIQEGKSGR